MVIIKLVPKSKRKYVLKRYLQEIDELVDVLHTVVITVVATVAQV